MFAATSRASARDVAVPLAGCGIPRSDSSVENRWRSSARSIESGDVPMIVTPAACSGSASFSGVCPPNCTRHGHVAAGAALLVEHRHHVLERQRLEVQAVRRVVVGRDGFRIAVDHHRLEAFLREGEGGVTAAVVELDALPDPVRAAAQDDDLLLRARLRLAERLERPVHVGRERLELGRARVDALVGRGDALLEPARAHRALVDAQHARRARGRRSPERFSDSSMSGDMSVEARLLRRLLQRRRCRRTAGGTTDRSS